jgi:hypothetical protein
VSSPQTLSVTTGQIVRGTIVAFAIAIVVLVVFVLPAEYAIDPTGIGRALGLLRPTGTVAIIAPTAGNVTPGQPVIREVAAYRTDELTVTLATAESVEIKAFMGRGRRFVFSWTAEGGPINVDMHSEPTAPAADGNYASYWKEDDQTGGHGAFEAPFDGMHGWYWQNLGAEPVTIRLKTAGYYDRIERLQQ